VVPDSKLDPLSTGLRAALDSLDASYQAVVRETSAALPVLNAPLKDVAPLVNAVDRFQNVLQNAITTALGRLNSSTTNEAARSILQTELHQALTREGVLGDRNGGGVGIGDVLVENLDMAARSVTIELRLGGTTRVAG